ncbi:MAG: DUF805 domain-containing protein, partial [Vampirovibrionales bacterium]
MKFKEAIATAWQKRWNFSGRASRSENNWVYLFNMLIGFILVVVWLVAFVPLIMTLASHGGHPELLKTELQQQGLAHPLVAQMGLPFVLGLLSFLALCVYEIWVGIPVIVRRLHDLNRTGWWYVILSFAPAVIQIVVEVLLKNAEGLVAVVSLLVDLASLVTWILLMCVKGTEGSNRYGEDP